MGMRRAVIGALVVLLGCRSAPGDGDAGESTETGETGVGDGNGDPGDGDGDEGECDIWTPSGRIGSRTAVMVFIHGGGNAVGSAVDQLYDAAKLADAQQAVVVTLNYRLGALANLTLPELDAERSDGVSGNLGMLDQIAALEWIHENIANFGGDPTEVLLFGESAGAVNVCALLGSPLADGLYSSSIIQSGSCAQPDRAALDQLSAEFVANSGCAGPDVLDCLRALPADELVFIAPNGYPDVAGLARGWGPHVDGVVLPQRSLERLAAGHDTPFVDYQAPGDAPTYAFHGLELVYLFANFDALGFAYEPSDAELELSLVLQQMWSEVAETGGFAAPQYEVGVDPYIELDVPNSTGAGLRTEQCDFWAQWIP